MSDSISDKNRDTKLDTNLTSFLTSLEVHSSEIACEACAHSIQRVLGKLSGVHNVQVDVDTKNIHVQYDAAATTEPEIYARLTKAGFPPEQGAR